MADRYCRCCLDALPRGSYFSSDVDAGGIPPPPFDKYPIRVEGVSKLLKKLPSIKCFVNEKDVDAVILANPEMTRDQFRLVQDGFKMSLPVDVGDGLSMFGAEYAAKVGLEFLHTPGHTPGSQCILVNNRTLISGDTLFIGSCGRVSFPDSCKHSMYDSLQNKLRKLSDDIVVFPGHDYGGVLSTVGNEKASGLLGNISKQYFMSTH